MKRILTLTAALMLTGCLATTKKCEDTPYGCNEGRAVASDTARPATPTKPAEKPTERPGPIKPDKPAGHKPGHGHGDSNHGHSGPRGHGKNEGRK